jgi:hypothetical protein
MNKHIPAILLAIISTVLAIGLYRSNREITTLEGKIAELERAPMPRSVEGSPPVKSPGLRGGDASPGAIVGAGVQPGEESAVDGAGPASRRMMSNLSKMLDNPTMNKVMVASQRGALNALYGDLIDSFEFTEEESDYFMDLLMSRQMKQVDFGMKLMGGEMGDEARKEMGEELKEVGETVKAEMEKFLNDGEDYAEFEFYEKTMGERMMLSQLTQQLEESEAPLSGETHRGLLEMMHAERKNFDFSTDLHDSEKMDVSAGRFSKENLRKFSDDMDQLNRNMVGKAKDLLAAEQLPAFEESIETMTEMQKSQMEMAANMFRVGEEEE